jgi:hypothetical protein
MAAEFQGKRIAVNALWPKTVIATAALVNLLGSSVRVCLSMSHCCRKKTTRQYPEMRRLFFALTLDFHRWWQLPASNTASFPRSPQTKSQPMAPRKKKKTGESNCKTTAVM